MLTPGSPAWRRAAALLTTLALSAALAGCAALPKGEKPDPRDRFERFNRGIYAFNTKVDHAVLRPVARGYVKITPAPVRTSVHNFLDNLAYTKTIINDFLQGKWRDGGTDTARLLFNTTLGLGGLFDPASGAGLDRHHTDFGQTLGIWGVHSGPYLMLPILGPSTVRDALGLLPDEYTTLPAYIRPVWIPWTIAGAQAVDIRVGLLDEDKLLENTFDPYAFLRNVWLQRRDYLIHGDTSASPEEPLPPDDDTGGAAAPH
ncbi:MAG: VacJ family lipoprotein [Steroidobacteraceae bacterium]|jgi:phospholipid-binding lipoprotein MlaA